MLVIAAMKAVVTHPVFSGNVDFCVSALLAVGAGVQLLVGGRSSRKKNSVLSAVIILLFCNAQFLQFAFSKRPPSPYQGVDFSAYYLAGKVLSERPISQSVYQLPRFADGRMNLNAETPSSSPWHADAIRYDVPFSAPYIYPPLLAILMKPLVHLPFVWAYRLWTLMTLLFVIASVAIVLKMRGVHVDGRLSILLGVGLFSYAPLLENLYFGQMGGVLLLLLTVGVWALSRNHVLASAFCYAVATFIKLTPVLAVPLLVVHRRWNWLIGYTGGMLSLLVFSVWQAGWREHQQFWHEVLPSISSGAPRFPNLSIVAFVQELLVVHFPYADAALLTRHEWVALIPRVVAFVVYLLMLRRCTLRRHEGDVARDLVVIGLIAIVVSPITWVHHFTAALLPFLYLWRRMPRTLDPLLLALLVAVGTNLIAMLRVTFHDPLIQVLLAAVVPGLTILVAYVALAPARELQGRDTAASTGLSDALTD